MLAAIALPLDRRYRQGGWLFLVMLLVFFVSSLLLYGLYALTRQNDPQSSEPLPMSFLTSTACLLVISGLVHWATRLVRRSKRYATSAVLFKSAIVAVGFMYLQYESMRELLSGPALQAGTGKGVAGMIAVLAFLHALHVAGGVASLAVVAIRSLMGRYDREWYWPVVFAAQYWHFLDLVWIGMLVTFALTTGGFAGDWLPS